MALTEKDLQSIKGLSVREASERLKKDGYNELPSSRGRNIFRIILEVFKEPMFILLVACGAIYLILGDVQEAVMLLGFVFFIIGITVYQEGKAERAIEALRDLSSPRALVIRDGVQVRIAGREVVRGDIIILREGDRVPADAVLLWGINMTADESLLTGESVPVRKAPSNGKDPAAQPNAPLAGLGAATPQPGGDDLPYVYSGSLVVQGQGIAEVMATGVHTEMGKIGKVLGTIEEEPTFLQKETGKLVKKVFIAAGILCFLVVVLYGLTKGDWLAAFLSGITLAMAMLPEEFPVVLTIFLALGAWRISKKNVLARKAVAVETLGSAAVLCVDKTGTLTQNRMSIQSLYNGSEFFAVKGDAGVALPESFHELVEYGILASKKDPFDPMETALKELGYAALYSTEHIHENWPLIEEYPLSRQIMALSHAWQTPDAKGYVISTKGAPEAIADLCHLGAAEKEALVRKINIMATDGLRVIGVAKAFFKRESLPSSQHDFDFKFIGLIGLADPIRATVPSAIKECYGAGIRVIMITGDYPATAQNIARQIGLRNADKSINGSDLEKMNPDELKERIREVNVFSRVVPEQKLLIVNALKANGEVVAMTGDGVNDAPALKAASIGVAMGGRGTDVARESSDLVLMDDDFSSIVEAVRLGRRIFDNLKKAMAYIISVHVPIAGAALVPIMFGWPLILYPAHIVFLELIIDPACSIVFESEPPEANIMIRPPRHPKESLFGRKMFVISVLQGVFALIVVMAVFKIALYLGQGERVARTLAFSTLLVSNICLILTNRSWSKTMIASFSVGNRALAFVAAGAFLFLGLAIYVPVLQKLFHFGAMHPLDIVICVAAGVWCVLWFELVKFVLAKFNIDLMNI